MLKRLGCLLVGLAVMVAVTARMPSAGAAPSAGTVLTATISPTSLVRESTVSGQAAAPGAA